MYYGTMELYGSMSMFIYRYFFFLQDYFFKLEKSCKFAKNLPEICTNLSKFARNVQIYNKKKIHFTLNLAKICGRGSTEELFWPRNAASVLWCCIAALSHI